MLRFGDEEVLLAAPPLLPALGRAVLPFVAAWPAAEPPQCMRDSEQARAGRAQLREARRSTVHVSAPAFPARSWSEGGAGEAHQHVDVAARSATQRFFMVPRRWTNIASSSIRRMKTSLNPHSTRVFLSRLHS